MPASLATDVLDYGQGIYAIDTHYVRARFDAAHLIVHAGRAAFVDCGTSHSVPRLLAALEALGLSPEAVDWLLLTHVHLDHAGGAGELLRRLPRARAVVHPRGAPHLSDPTKLVAASIAVYGEARYAQLYGEIHPIDAARVVATADDECLSLAGRELRVLHTPGHALHHQVYFDTHSQGVFTGDTFGVSYREFDVEGRAFSMPTTSPTQFDPEQLKASVRKIIEYAPRQAFLTHYGRIDELSRVGTVLERQISLFESLARTTRAATSDTTVLRDRLHTGVRTIVLKELREHGCMLSDDAIDAILGADYELNADGLIAWLARAAV